MAREIMSGKELSLRVLDVFAKAVLNGSNPLNATPTELQAVGEAQKTLAHEIFRSKATPPDFRELRK